MSAFELVSYDAGRRSDYLRLLADVWRDRAMSAEAFDWWFDGNPAGSLRAVALREGSVVGGVGHSLYRARLGGEERLLQVAVQVVTDPSARGLGVFRAIERRLEEEGEALGSSCALVFANASSRPIFAGPLEWQRIDRRRVWARPLRGALGRLRGRRPRGGPARRGGDLGAVSRVERFDAATDRLYERVAPRLGNHLVRDARYLNWRYVESPRHYRALASEDGFAVVGHDERRGAALATLLELVAEPAGASALLRACVREAAGGADALLAVPSRCLPRGMLARHGFAPTPFRLDFLGKGLVDPLDARSRAWTISLGDTDFF